MIRYIIIIIIIVKEEKRSTFFSIFIIGLYNDRVRERLLLSWLPALYCTADMNLLKLKSSIMRIIM